VRRVVVIGSVSVVLAGAALIAAFRPSAAAVPTVRVTGAPFIRRVTAEGNLKAVKATAVAAPQQAPGGLKIAWIADDGSLLKKDDVIVRFDPTTFEKDLLGGNEDHTTASNNMLKTDVQAGATRANLHRDVSQAQRELEAAQRFNFDDDEIFSKYQRIDAEVDAKLASDRMTHANSLLGVRAGLARTEHDLVAIEDKKAALRIRNATQGLQALEIRAPYDGILVLQRDWRGDVPRVGASVWPGMTLGEIPDLAKMKAEVFVLEADAAGLSVDKRAAVTLESNPGVTYTGKVTQVDKLARPRVRGVPVQYFGVTVMLDRTEPRVMKPGARVRAVVDVENRDRAFAIPRQALFEKDGKKLVYRREHGKFVPVRVEIATSSAGRVVVTKGLVDGDEIALVDPFAQPFEQPAEKKSAA
jgi:multidrug efflux pump subunit AcrA (membrane-fusion protein)